MTGILLVDKEQDWTSSDVVAKLRGVLRERRIGHAGTLDPLATGLLVVMVGRATRASDYLMRHNKKYRARMRFGVTTDTQDITGTVLSQKACSISREQVEDVLPHFLGEILQIPPMYSAIKIKGKKLYEIARRGGEIERQPRSITVSDISLAGWEAEELVLDITCSAGTYIRTLCHDIGQELGCGACMTGLRRTASGNYRVEQAHTVSEIEHAVRENRLDHLLHPVDSIFSDYPALYADREQEARLRCGSAVSSGCPEGIYRVYSPSGEFLLIGKVLKGQLMTEKSFFEVKK